MVANPKLTKYLKPFYVALMTSSFITLFGVVGDPKLWSPNAIIRTVFKPLQIGNRRNLLTIAIGIIIILAVVPILLITYLNQPIQQLELSSRDSQLRIKWDHTSRPVRGAAKGSLEISDGQNKKMISLSLQDLAADGFTYVTKSGDVNVILTLIKSKGSTADSVLRGLFIGPPVFTTTPPDPLVQLRKQNADQAERIRSLEYSLNIMRAQIATESRTAEPAQTTAEH